MQTIFVLFIVFFILSIVGIFLFAQQKAANNIKVDEHLTLAQIKKSKMIALLPEVQYSSNNVVLDDHYDKLALASFKNIIQENPQYYKSILGSIKLTILEYDFQSGWSEEVYYNNELLNYSNKKNFQVPIVLTNPENYEKKIGVIYVEIYS